MPDTIVQAIVAEETMQCLYFDLQTQISPEFSTQHCRSDKLLVEEFHFSFGRNHKLIVFDNFDIDVHHKISVYKFSSVVLGYIPFFTIRDH